MDKIGKYKVVPFKRQLQAEVTAMSKHMLYMTGLIELDITDAREFFRCYKEKHGESLSFTAWIVRCVAAAVNENLEVHTFRKRNKLYIFEDVDVSISVEKTIDGKPFPTLYNIRKANEKDVMEIHKEIREVQRPKKKEDISSDISARQLNLMLKLPKFVRKLIFFDRVMRNPIHHKKLNSTVQITTIGMFGKGMSGWGLNLGHHPLNIVTGGISFKPRFIDGELVNREILNMTLRIDHVVTDGAPSVRFIRRLGELVEGAFELEKYCK
ncbi:MAG: 2-oxo acid dehydrogenase subunit E2 [Candidatus Heimdallarchaeota archaeon]|nr:2-oxo acid dehydrogenase subunit E2 [Candidatus Heimdallarchaeota archaeon]